MALPNPPSIKVLPSAAYDAGCRASCTISGPEIDGRGNEIYDCSFSATPSTGWRFVDFTWRQSLIVYHKGDGTTTDESFDVSSIENPTDPSTALARIGITESRYTRSTHDVLNVVANFEPVAPTTYTITATASPLNGGTVQVGSAAAGSTSTLANITAGSSIQVTATAAAGFVFSRWSDAGPATHNITVNSNMTLTAYFRTPTHLLVNSSTVENPAKLVYDPTTNLLVADF